MDYFNFNYFDIIDCIKVTQVSLDYYNFSYVMVATSIVIVKIKASYMVNSDSDSNSDNYFANPRSKVINSFIKDIEGNSNKEFIECTNLIVE